MTLFDILENILFRKCNEQLLIHCEHIDFKSVFSNYMILRYCSMTNNDKINSFMAREAIYLEKLDSRILYKHLLKILPKQKKHFIKYIK